MADDKEILELAAKAAGYIWIEESFDASAGIQLVNLKMWNPLTDDGDALRLAVKLGMIVEVDNDAGFTGIYFMPDDEEAKEAEEHIGDPYAATRRAIVLAAAEIGRSKK